MKSLATRPLFHQVLVTLACIAGGVFIGALTGLISLPSELQSESEAELLPTVCEELSLEQYESILSQPHGCQQDQYLEDQIRFLEVRKKTMQEIESEIVVEQLESIEYVIEDLKKLQRSHQEEVHGQ